MGGCGERSPRAGRHITGGARQWRFQASHRSGFDGIAKKAGSLTADASADSAKGWRSEEGLAQRSGSAARSGKTRSGEVTDHGELARLGHVSPARLCQYMTLLHLAPAIQEYLLLLAVSQASPISEVGLRRIARESRWDRQRAVFESVLVRKGCLRHLLAPWFVS